MLIHCQDQQSKEVYDVHMYRQKNCICCIQLQWVVISTHATLYTSSIYMYEQPLNTLIIIMQKRHAVNAHSVLYTSIMKC